MRFENTEVWGFEHSIRGMRNPLASWGKSDSKYCHGRSETCNTCSDKPYDDYAPCYWAEENIGKLYVVGENDLGLMQRLIKSGSEHRKFMRQIFVSVDITAPTYFMAELDTYKIGVTRNSSSFMHKGVAKEFEVTDFDCEDVLIKGGRTTLYEVIYTLNELRIKYLETKDYDYFRAIRQLLPSSYLYRSTVTMNYENIYNMIHQRKNHRLKEWSQDFVEWAKTLPYADELLFLEGGE